jgi:hypothetical protein
MSLSGNRDIDMTRLGLFWASDDVSEDVDERTRSLKRGRIQGNNPNFLVSSLSDEAED